MRLSHGNLVPVFDSGQVAGEIYLAMDYVEGKDLRATWNRCAKKGIAFPVDVAAHIVKELARGLDYAHGFGDIKLVHRDVSPPNVLLSYSGEVRLTDFGLASSTLKLEKTAPGIIYGKVSYMSPEQARGETLDGRTDLYASGIILWELLTGRQLFPSGKAPGAPKDGTPPRRSCARAQSRTRAAVATRVARAARAGPHRAEGAGARSEASVTRAARSCATIWRRSSRRRRPRRIGAAGRLPPRPVRGGHRGGAHRARGADHQVARVVLGEARRVPPPPRRDASSASRGSASGRRRCRRRSRPSRPARRQRSAASDSSGTTARERKLDRREPSLGSAIRARRRRRAATPVADGVAGRQPLDAPCWGPSSAAATTCGACCGEGGMGARLRSRAHRHRQARRAEDSPPRVQPDARPGRAARREARAASKISHPNVVDVTDSGPRPRARSSS